MNSNRNAPLKDEYDKPMEMWEHISAVANRFSINSWKSSREIKILKWFQIHFDLNWGTLYVKLAYAIFYGSYKLPETNRPFDNRQVNTNDTVTITFVNVHPSKTCLK